MKKVTVNASQKYDVIIGSGILRDLGAYSKKVTAAKKFAVVTDDNVNKLYGDIVIKSLEKEGFSVCRFVFPHGEASKCSSILNDLYMFLSENHITRADCIAALGGGVTGDMAGYAAATYLRGLDYIQIPTSLLAQVDSSVGGKTAIDLPCGKNLVGAFKQPKLVLADVDTLDTLSGDFFVDGMGEVVKYGMIKSKELFDILSENNISSVKNILDDIVARCVSIKRDVVEADEFDKGERMLLNFGHTLGHSIEQYYNFTGISHGRAVSMGMAKLTQIAERKNMCRKGTYEKLVSCLGKYELPFETDIPLTELIGACLNDKKRMGGSISIVICEECGVSHTVKMPVEEFAGFFS